MNAAAPDTATVPPLPASPPRHRLALWGMVLVVLLAHAWVTWQVAGEMQALSPKDSIERMEATYVSEVRLSRPPVAAAVAAPLAPVAPASGKAKAAKPRKPRPADKAASAPLEAASSPAPESASAPALALAASAPDPDTASTVVAATPQPAPVASAASTPVVPQPLVAAASKPELGPTFVWPKATRVSYKLEGHFRGPIYGQAAVQWVRQEARYQVHVDASVGPSFAPLGSWRLTSEGEITPEGLLPRRYENTNRLLIRNSVPRTIGFEGNEVLLDNGQRLPRQPGMQDPASQFIQLAYRFIMNPALLTVGNTVEMPMAWIKNTELIAYDVVNEEVLQTPIGEVPTVHVKPRRVSTEPSSFSAEIWFAPGLQYLPVRILARMGEISMDMQMDKAPQQSPGDQAPAP